MGLSAFKYAEGSHKAIAWQLLNKCPACGLICAFAAPYGLYNHYGLPIMPVCIPVPACLFPCTGAMRGQISQSEPGQLLLNMDWDQPVKGSGVDLFTLEEGGLVVQSSVTIGGVTQRFRSVYSRG